MAQISLIAKNYAGALFGAAQDKKCIDKINSDLEIFKKNFTKDFANELENPAIAKADCIEIIKEVGAKLNLSELFMNFLENLTKNRRLNFLGEIYTEFSHLIKEEKNILELEVISSTELDKSTVDDIIKAVNKKYPNKTIEAKQTLKSDILGGLQIKIGSNLIDASLKNKLALIEKELIALA